MPLKDIPIESLSGLWSDGRSPLTGTASLIPSLQMNLGSLELLLRSLTGKGQAGLQERPDSSRTCLFKMYGHFKRARFINGQSRPPGRGSPLRSTGRILFHRKWQSNTQDLTLKSPVLKLTASGSYDRPTENLNGMIAVTLLEAYSNLLKGIPPFGSFMKEKRKSLMTALFEIKGPRTEPTITYLPPESFTGELKGLAQLGVDVLRNVITLSRPEKENPMADRSTP